MMGAEPSAPSLSPEEAIAEELCRRHGERALLIEARTGTDGRIRLLAVLDLEEEALETEAKRHQVADDAGPFVEVIDRPTWLAMRRLAASGMIKLSEDHSRALHRSPDFAAAADANFAPEKRAAELCGEAERSLRMARVLAAGGFPEEALPLIAKAIGIAAAARLAALGELPVGVSTATSAQIRDLVDRGAFAPQAEAALSALWSHAGGRGVGDIISLIDNATLAVAGINERKRAKAA
jgi:hypothetical protein